MAYKPVSVDKYQKSLAKQAASIAPPSVVVPNDSYPKLLGDYLRSIEERRASACQGMSMWPQVREGDRFTGQPLTLYRSLRSIKADAPNPNYGRFYVASRIPMVNAQGEPILDDNGRQRVELASFQWFDATDYVTHGFFEVMNGKNKTLMDLLLHAYGPSMKEANLWPAPKAFTHMHQAVVNQLHAADQQLEKHLSDEQMAALAEAVEIPNGSA